MNASPFRLLADPAGYVACDWDLTADREGLNYWIGHFYEHYRTLVPLIDDVYRPGPAQMERFAVEYLAELDRVLADPARFGRVTILVLDELRDRYLRRFGFPDPYLNVKRKENIAALAFYPKLIAELDSQTPDRRLLELVQGVFAGNIFDLGAMATVRQYREGGLDFFHTRASLPKRPWLEDDLDGLCDRWRQDRWRYRKVLFFVDNAGCDFVLGCLPLIREFATERGDCRVVVAVNTGASLNDILAPEVEQVLAAARAQDAKLDSALAGGRIGVVESGNCAPLIDLGKVSSELNAAADGADLLILEGMGRSVESNHYAKFTVDTAKLALLKDPRVAQRVGGHLFDICCKFEPA